MGAHEQTRVDELSYTAADFWNVPDPLPAGDAGRLIRVLPIYHDPYVRIYRTMYHSTSVDGVTPVAVTGVIHVPIQAPPEGGFPIAAWSPSFDGMGEECTYTHRIRGQFSEYDNVTSSLVRDGFVVAVTDYEGHGTRFTYPFAVGESATHALLDGARSARDLLGPAAGNRVVIAGHGLGAEMANQAQVFAPDYDDGLDVRGVVALNGGSDFGRPPIEQIDPRNVAVDFRNMYFVKVFAQFYPELDNADLFNPRGLELLAELNEEQCFPYSYGDLPQDPVWGEMETIKLSEITKAWAIDVPDWAERLRARWPMRAPYPVWYIVAGDETAPADLIRATATRLCETSDEVLFSVVQGADHDTVVDLPYPAYGPWLVDRVTTDKPVAGCDGLTGD